MSINLLLKSINFHYQEDHSKDWWCLSYIAAFSLQPPENDQSTVSVGG